MRISPASPGEDWGFCVSKQELAHIIDCMLLATLSMESRNLSVLERRSATADMLYAFQRRSAP